MKKRVFKMLIILKYISTSYQIKLIDIVVECKARFAVDSISADEEIELDVFLR